MTQTTHASLSPPARRPALWPWLAMPLAVLVLFALLHTVKQSGTGAGIDTDPAAAIDP